MKKYRVVLKETVFYFTDIEAENAEKAAEIGAKLYAKEEFPNDLQELDTAVIKAHNWDVNDPDESTIIMDEDTIERYAE